jgi:putative addiction module component (TIGR02574 family)
MSKDQLMSEALKLEPAEREILAEELLRSLGDRDREEIDAAWLEEVKRRDADYRAGKIGAKPVEEVLQRLLSKGKS